MAKKSDFLVIYTHREVRYVAFAHIVDLVFAMEPVRESSASPGAAVEAGEPVAKATLRVALPGQQPETTEYVSATAKDMWRQMRRLGEA